MTSSAAIPQQTNKAFDVMLFPMYAVHAQQVESNMLPADGLVSDTARSRNKVHAGNCKARKAHVKGSVAPQACIALLV